MSQFFSDMRLLILILFILTLSCGGISDSVTPEKSIVDSWKLMGMTKKPFPIEEVTESDLMCGSLNFKPDKTFDGEVIYPKTPENNLKVFGTYKIENDIITISNQVNSSVTESKIRFEKNFMILTPLNPDAFIAYYKRLD